MNSIAKLLVGTDFSAVSDHALRYAIDLAAQLGASVEVLHAFALPSFNLPLEGALISTPQAAADHSIRAQEQLDQQLRAARREALRCAGTCVPVLRRRSCCASPRRRRRT